MCGINGIFLLNQNKLNLKSSIIEMNSTINYRGPDNTNFISEKLFALGHNRLSIIDLDKRSNQPMKDCDGFLYIVFNGEIYNFIEIRNELQKQNIKFFTKSDTEVILNGYKFWGEDIIKKLQGFYSFCIYDTRKQEVFITRDKHGIKPLFYYLDDEMFCFSSEIKPLLKLKINKEIDYKSILSYLNIGYINSPNSPFKYIKQVLPGEEISFKLKGGKIFHETKNDLFNNLKINDKDLYKIIDQSIKDSLISDVQVGLLLSSGLDSNIINYHCEKNHYNLNTLSIGFKNNKSYDEIPIIKGSLKNINKKNKFIYLEDFNIEKLFCETVFHLDSLNSNVANIAIYSIFKEASKFNKVFLVGTGLDELFGGYMTYKASVINDFIFFLPKKISKFISFIIYKSNLSNGSKYNFYYLLMKFFQEQGKGPLISHLSWRSFWNDEEITKFLNNKVFISDFSNLIEQCKINENENVHISRLKLDYKSFLIDNQNLMIDNLSMANSVEARPCFLQDSIFNYAFNTPSSKKFGILSNKKILRNLYKDKISSRILKNKKQGLVMPIDNIINDHLMHLLDEACDNPFFKNFFNIEQFTKFLKNFKKNKNNFDIYKIYNILTLHQWTKFFLR
jgi:asparagine synthase (glutamine-hydrolysing)